MSQYPATRAYRDVRGTVDEVSISPSLFAIDGHTLRRLDVEAHKDDALRTFRDNLIARLHKAHGVDDVVAFSQAYEVYA